MLLGIGIVVFVLFMVLVVWFNWIEDEAPALTKKQLKQQKELEAAYHANIEKKAHKLEKQQHDLAVAPAQDTIMDKQPAVQRQGIVVTEEVKQIPVGQLDDLYNGVSHPVKRGPGRPRKVVA